MTIRKLLLSDKGAPPDSSWFVKLWWALIDMDESDAVKLDSDIAAQIWPEYAPHTISWNLGRLIMTEHDQNALRVCAVLAQFLGPGHCQNAYEHGE